MKYHEAIMVNESLEGLNIKENGVYVDCTFGGGGHSKAILERLGKSGKLIAFDQDEAAKENLLNDERFVFYPHNFCYLKNFLRLGGFEKVDGVLADLGVSSHQIDEKERGFSLRFDDELLDMRMDRRSEFSALEILKTYSAERLANVFFEFGELLNSRQLAAEIVEYRKLKEIKTLGDLKLAIKKQIKGIEHKYLTKVLQALRIEVNQELNVLKKMLLQTPTVLKIGGRLVILSFHSLEDRIVKQFMRNEVWLNDKNKHAENQEEIWKMLTKKPIEASFEEIKKNKRSKSAKLRIAEKLF